MKVLVALSRFPWPLEKGDKLRAYYQIKGLSQDHEVHLVCLSEHAISQADRDALGFCKSIKVIRHGRFRRIGNLLKAVFSSTPFQVHYFHSPEMKNALVEVIDREKIDAVFVQLIRLGLNLPNSIATGKGPGWFLDYMDCFSIGMENRIEKSKWPVRTVVKMEANRLKSYEKQIAARFDGYSMISERDAAGLDPILREEVRILPNGVGDHFFEIPANPPTKRYDLIFFGNMGYQPNVESAKYLVEEVVPALKTEGVDPQLCIAGARPAKSIQAYANDKIEVTGFVDDIKEYVLAARLAIAPVIGGQGLQNKLIESMALGIPTLTTPHAHQAVGAESGKEIIVCKDAKAFAVAIKELLADPEKAEAIGQAGKRFVEENYQWDAMNRTLVNFLEDVAK